jgi:hypothetical protein
MPVATSANEAAGAIACFPASLALLNKATSIPAIAKGPKADFKAVPKEAVADYFEAYAKKYKAPIRTGVEVKSVSRL